ncbi:MAG: polysaccharide deacetylase family protein [Planctomycetia bacterium]|nr:polysaccharide deacetylase family protein [Planctomycetia bacterium]
MTLPLLPLGAHNVPEGFLLALGQEGIPWVEASTSPWLTRFVLYDSRRGPPPLFGDDQAMIDVAPLCCGKSDTRGTSEDLAGQIVRQDSALFSWNIGGLVAREEIAAVDKRDLRRQMMSALRKKLEEAGGVWVKVSPFPFPYRSAFNFRFDHDTYVPADLSRLLEAIDGAEGATTHFVCGSAYKKHPEALARLRGLDVQCHGYWHHTYRDRETNLRNIERGLDVLRDAGFEPRAFAAPHGRYNPGLAAALDELKLAYSSEFALAYDETPFLPAGSRVWQVPVHPVSLGIVLEAARSREDDLAATAVQETAKHFQEVARRKYESGDPVFLYGHPDGRLGRYPLVVKRVLETAATFGALWKTTLTDFARWWGVRARCSLRLYRQEESFLAVVERRPRGFLPALEIWREERVALLPIDGPLVRFCTSSLAFQRRRAPEDELRPMRVDRRHSLRGSFQRFIDWEKATPASEIEVRSLRDLMKKTLRMIRG